MIREAKEDDFDSIIEMSSKFWLETMFDEPFDPDHTMLMVEMAYDHKLLAVIEVDSEVVGFVAGIAAPTMGSPDAIAGTELAWWINPEHRNNGNGLKLINFIEGLARIAGVKYWNMVAMESSNPRVAEAIYQKLGYFKSETMYTRIL